MLCLTIPQIKKTMGTLFTSTAFDNFLVSEITIVNGATLNIDGHITKNSDETEESFQLPYMEYGKVRPAALEFIKGTHTPSYIKLVLTLSPDNIKNTLESISCPLTVSEVNGMFINLTYQSGKITVTSGISYAIFTKNIELEHEWDRLIQKFLVKIGIEYESLV